MGPASILTVGHSTLAFDTFAASLERWRVDTVVDVRSSPFSRRLPDYDQRSLTDLLAARGIRYVFFGNELGGRPMDRSVYRDGQVRYDLLGRSETFRGALDQVAGAASRQRLALLCAEGDPLRCHRGLLIAPELARRGVRVIHLLPSGDVESHRQTMDRLLEMMGESDLQFFDSPQQVLEDAIVRQTRRIAYVDPGLREVREVP